MVSEQAVEGDRGLQPERTALAWRRTALALLVAWAAVAHVGLARFDRFAATIAVAACAGAVIAIWLTRSATATDKQANVGLSGLLLTSACVMLGALTFVLLLLGAG